MLSSSAMPAVAGSRSRGSRTISVRPPLSSVMSRSAATLTRSSDNLRDELPPPVIGGGCGHRAWPSRHAGERERNRHRNSGRAAARGARASRPRRRCRSRRPALRSRESAASGRGCPRWLDGVVAVRDHDERLLAIAALLRQRNRFGRPRRTSPCRRSASCGSSALEQALDDRSSSPAAAPDSC